jgi:hypothetical protein
MRWIAWATTMLVAVCGLSSVSLGQITAQPARPFNSAPPYSTTNYGVGPVGYSPAGSLVSVTQGPEANSVRNWYRDYLGRDVGQDLPALVGLLRGGMSPTDLQATILGSDEFYSQNGRDPQAFVRDTLQAVTWTDPTYAEVQRWTDRLNQLRGDRFALAREILLGSQTQSPTSQVNEVAARLSGAARLAMETIDFEIGGTTQGRQARLQAQSLLDAANQLQQVAVTRPNDVARELANVERSYQALQLTLSNPPGTAPSAAGVVRRMGTMLADARMGGSSSGYGSSVINLPYPPSTIPGGVGGSSGYGQQGYGQQQLLDQVAAARRAAESLIQTLTSQSYIDYSYNVVLRDLDTLASRLASLDPLVRSGAPRDRVSWEVQTLVDSAARIRTQLGTSRLPYSARLYWQSLESSLTLLRDSAGVAPGAGSTTLLRPTTLHENLLPLLDQAASQIDVFLAGISPLVYGIPDVPSIQADARSLKNRVLLMRQQAGGGQPASVLKQTLSGMVIDYQAAFDRWNRVVSVNRLTNPARLSTVGEILNRVEQLINQALVSGDLTPSGPTRVTQDLALLNGEVADARRGLTQFAGYREQQSINLYLEQLSGYVQQLNTAVTQPTSLDARRLAVGMQGVVGRMQADVDSLNQQAAVGRVPTVQQQASDLQFRVSRIGRLVDDVESQLY